MSTLILFNKPFQVLSQFTDDSPVKQSGRRATLADWLPMPSVYPAGRLDFDSEGLLLLTDSGALQHQIAAPENKLPKTYWVQVEGQIDDAALHSLRHGVRLKDGKTRPARAEHLAPPDLWPRFPPVRYRQTIPTSWISLTLTEGRNRQVRRMTAAVGFPTLRLIRYSIGEWAVKDLAPGAYRTLNVHAPAASSAAARPRNNASGRHPSRTQTTLRRSRR